MTSLNTEVAVIGGGAAGLMAAVSAAENGAGVIVIERMARPLMKLRITGKGRCNVTNNCSVSEVMQNIPVNSRFLYSALNGFTPADTMTFFENLGVPLKTERGNRVFPVSDKANDVAEALLRYASELSVKIIRAKAEAIKTKDGRVYCVDCGQTRVECRAAVLCTGGLSYPKTGSDGTGYAIARRLGHRVTELSPSLVPLTSDDTDCAAMQGLSLKNVTLTLTGDESGAVFKEMGEMQFTHFGISGPLALSASSHMNRGVTHTNGGTAHIRKNMNTKEKYSAVIDLKPAIDETMLDARILRDFSENINRDFKNALDGLLPRLMIPVIIKRSGISPETKVNSITKEQRRQLVLLLKHFTVDISGTRPVDEAVITSGGVEIKEINPSTMESKLVGGLFFAGEIIDADAYTGGFNLQIAWSTGYAAGRAAAQYLYKCGDL
jgi:predicted Rossmann fold flavoprotein